MFQRLILPPSEVTEKVRETAKIVSPFAIGQPLYKTITALAEQVIIGGIMQPSIVVYEIRLLYEIDQKQRFDLSTMTKL